MKVKAFIISILTLFLAGFLGFNQAIFFVESKQLEMNNSLSTQLDSPPPVVAKAGKLLSNSIFNLFTPISFEVLDSQGMPPTATKVKITEIYFYGSKSDPRSAELLAVAYPENSTSIPPNKLLSNSDNQNSLASTALRITNQLKQEMNQPPDWVSVIKLNAIWDEGRLKILTQDAEISKISSEIEIPGYVLNALKDKMKPIEIINISTFNLAFTFNINKTINTSLSISFGNDYIALAFLPSEFEKSLPAPNSPVFKLDQTGIAEESNFVLSVPYAFLNYIFIKNFGNQSVTVAKTKDNKNIQLIKPSLSAVKNDVDITYDERLVVLRGNLDTSPFATVDPEGAPKIQISAFLSGDDLRLSKFEVSKTVECGSLKGLLCAQLLAEVNVAAVYVLHKYKDTLIRPDKIINLGSLQIDQTKVTANLFILKIHPDSNEDTLKISANLSLEK